MRSREMRMFVATINSMDIFFEADICAESYWDTSVLGNVRGLVTKSGLKANRKEPKKIKVQVDCISIKDGKQVRSFYNKYDVMPPLERMTEDEFVEEQNDVLSKIPHEFHDAFKSMAWDRGHSCGYEEVISYLNELVNDLGPFIEAFRKRVTKPI